MLVKMQGTAESIRQPERAITQPFALTPVSLPAGLTSSTFSTSFVERQNLNIRKSMRRFTQLTNALSKKELRVTPAMEAGVTDHASSIEETIALLDTGVNQVDPLPGRKPILLAEDAEAPIDPLIDCSLGTRFCSLRLARGKGLRRQDAGADSAAPPIVKNRVPAFNFFQIRLARPHNTVDGICSSANRVR
jgi:hypothetical protein